MLILNEAAAVSAEGTDMQAGMERSQGIICCDQHALFVESGASLKFDGSAAGGVADDGGMQDGDVDVDVEGAAGPFTCPSARGRSSAAPTIGTQCLVPCTS